MPPPFHAPRRISPQNPKLSLHRLRPHQSTRRFRRRLPLRRLDFNLAAHPQNLRMLAQAPLDPLPFRPSLAPVPQLHPTHGRPQKMAIRWRQRFHHAPASQPLRPSATFELLGINKAAQIPRHDQLCSTLRREQSVAAPCPDRNNRRRPSLGAPARRDNPRFGMALA